MRRLSISPTMARALAVLGLTLAVSAGQARGAEYYAATTGSPAGSGSLGDPWDLQTALNGGKPTGTLQPGDTVWVRGGLYLAPFTSHLRGAPGQPIIVRNYPGERVILDAQYANCDPAKCPPQEWQDAHPFFPSCPPPNGGLNYQCNAYNGINPCDTTTNPACTAPFNYRIDTLTIPTWSHDVWIWGFDLTNYTNAPRAHVPAFCTPENPGNWKQVIAVVSNMRHRALNGPIQGMSIWRQAPWSRLRSRLSGLLLVHGISKRRFAMPWPRWMPISQCSSVRR